MAQRLLHPRLIQDRILELGITGAEIARRIGLTRNNFSRVLAGKRDLSIEEAKKLAAAIDFPLKNILIALGIADLAILDTYLISVMAVLRDDDSIWIENQHQNVPAPFAGYDGLVIRIDGAQCAPRFLSGEFIGCFGGLRTFSTPLENYKKVDDSPYREIPEDIEAIIGSEVVVLLPDPDGQLLHWGKPRHLKVLLKRLQRGSSPGLYTLLSLNPSGPPIFDVRPVSMSALDWHIPRSRFGPIETINAARSHARHLEYLADYLLSGQPPGHVIPPL